MSSIAVAIPCHNEQATIAKVVQDFRAALPDAEIHVFDNASTDASAELATAAGAVLHQVPIKGKGHVVRTIFRRLDADAVVLVDGDDTYSASHVSLLVAPVLAGTADMVVATRMENFAESSFRPFHQFGNQLIKSTVNGLFRAHLRDILSGYRCFSRRFIKTCPILSPGFEVETELTVHAVQHSMVVKEVSVPYRERPPGSFSKLSTIRDGFRVMLTILKIYLDFRPLVLFGTLGCASVVTGLFLGLLVIQEYQEFQHVVGAARAVLSLGLCLLGSISLTAGIILDSINRRMRSLYTLLADHVIAGR